MNLESSSTDHCEGRLEDYLVFFKEERLPKRSLRFGYISYILKKAAEIDRSGDKRLSWKNSFSASYNGIPRILSPLSELDISEGLHPFRDQQVFLIQK